MKPDTKMGNRPNIILLFPDQQRADALGCAGNPVIHTPNIDRLANEGVLFSRCYTNSPLCMPARASLHTGQHVCGHGVWNNQLAADPAGPNLAGNIRNAGYRTAYVGKTHLWCEKEGPGGVSHTRHKIPVIQAWGFDDVHEITGPRVSTRLDSPYTDHLRDKDLLRQYMTYEVGSILQVWARKGVTKRPASIERRIKEYGISTAVEENDAWLDPPWPLPTEDHLDSYTGIKAAEWIQNYNDTRPFFLMVGFPGPHDPFDSPTEYRDMYNPEDMPLGIMEKPQVPVPQYLQSLLKSYGTDKLTDAQLRELMVAYYAKITLIDEYIGRVLHALEEKGLMENTWIIYTSDHGELLGDHRLLHKMTYYEGALRIPCIVRPAGGCQGWQSAALADQIDLTATTLEIAGAKPITASEGRSLLPKILAGPHAPRSQQGKPFVFSEVWGRSMVFDGRFKLVVHTKTRKPIQLFDLETDQDELSNAVDDADLEDVRNRLLDEMKGGLFPRFNGEKFKAFENHEVRPY